MRGKRFFQQKLQICIVNFTLVHLFLHRLNSMKIEALDEQITESVSYIRGQYYPLKMVVIR